MSKAYPIALVGIGQIARDQHVPVIAASADFTLAATVSRHNGIDGVHNHRNLALLLAERPDITTVALCTPPQVRHALAAQAIAAGRHVLLEKPPGATLAEVDDLIGQAKRAGVSLFATWHSRFSPAVPQAKAWLAGQQIRRTYITWKEDVRQLHPGQQWIWQPGGFGVLDPGINALSILTEIMPFGVFLTGARLEFPANCHTPIAAHLHFNAGITAEFDWRYEQAPLWNIEIETSNSQLRLSGGGRKLEIDGAVVVDEPETGYAGLEAEYKAIYNHFADLIATGRSDVDLSPQTLVADAFTLGERVVTEAFYE